jgi:hypothetical protein
MIGYYSPVSDQPFAPQKRRSSYSGALVSAANANVVFDVRIVNGEAQLWAAGARNHAAPIEREALDLYHFIARAAPGSYGLLYIQDDEDPVHYNDFQMYLVARGVLTEHADHYLSPFVPVIEDPTSH